MCRVVERSEAHPRYLWSVGLAALDPPYTQGNRTLFVAKGRKDLKQDAFIPAGAQPLAA